MDKADGAFLTIGELAKELGVAQHILRYWETRFPQLRPLQRSGNRRYYRPSDVETAQRINQLLNEQGFTVRGAQRVLDGKSDTEHEPVTPAPLPVPAPLASPSMPVRPQAELALGELASSDRSPADRTALRRMRGQFDSSDVALLIARLTVIRENLVEALGVG